MESFPVIMTRAESHGSWIQISIGLNLLIGRLMNIRFIDELDSRLYTACAGCGLSAKSSNELGRIASRKILENRSGYDKIQSQENFVLFKVPDSLNSITNQTQHHKTALSAEA